MLGNQSRTESLARKTLPGQRVWFAGSDQKPAPIWGNTESEVRLRVGGVTYLCMKAWVSAPRLRMNDQPSTAIPPLRPLCELDDFERVDIRVGQIIAAEPFPEARKPAMKLTIDFGPLGIKRSSAQVTVHYTVETLINRRVLAVVNFPPRRIAGFSSDVLTLGVTDADGAVVLVQPAQDVPLGSQLY